MPPVRARTLSENRLPAGVPWVVDASPPAEERVMPKNRMPYHVIATVMAIFAVLAFFTSQLTYGVVLLALAIIVTAYGDTHRSGDTYPR
jgi:hypothetical protein